MSIYLNAVIMLLATITAFLVLAKLLEAVRAGRLSFQWRGRDRSRLSVALSQIAIEQTCNIDGKRRLLLVRCDDQRILLMTGGPTDLVVSAWSTIRATETVT